MPGCPKDCEWAAWGEWEACDRNYGRGNQERRRQISVFGQNGGTTCQSEDAVETKECFVQAPKCDLGPWSEWSPALCPETNVHHSQTRERSFIDEAGKFTGYDCSQQEKVVETRPCKGCPVGWHYKVNGDQRYCYKVLRSVPTNWAQAKTACREENGYLAEITTDAENEAVLQYLRKFYRTSNVWIGLNDIETENEFEWANSKTKLGDFKDWYIGEPNNWRGNEDCVFIYKNTWQWNDRGCSLNFNGNSGIYPLCEYDFEDYAGKIHALLYYLDVNEAFIQSRIVCMRMIHSNTVKWE